MRIEQMTTEDFSSFKSWLCAQKHENNSILVFDSFGAYLHLRESKVFDYWMENVWK